jgi:hypothetical protein
LMSVLLRFLRLPHQIACGAVTVPQEQQLCDNWFQARTGRFTIA